MLSPHARTHARTHVDALSFTQVCVRPSSGCLLCLGQRSHDGHASHFHDNAEKKASLLILTSAPRSKSLSFLLMKALCRLAHCERGFLFQLFCFSFIFLSCRFSSFLFSTFPYSRGRQPPLPSSPTPRGSDACMDKTPPISRGRSHPLRPLKPMLLPSGSSIYSKYAQGERNFCSELT